MPDQATQYSPAEFAAVLRQMHPEFADEKDDDALTGAVLKLYPDFQQHVQAGPAKVGTPPPELQPKHRITLGQAPGTGPGAASSIGPDPGGRPMLPLPGEYNFEAGFPRVARGFRNALRDPFMHNALRNVTDVVGGGMQAAEPLMAIPAALAPLPTAAAVVTGTIAQKATEWATEHITHNPVLSELTGAIAALVGGGKGASMAHGAPVSDIAMPRNIPSEARFQTNVYDVANRGLEARRAADVTYQQGEQVKKLHAGIAVNAGLNYIAQQAKASTGTGGSAFSYLDQAGRVADTGRQLTAGTPPPEPKLLAENAGPGGSETRPSVISAPAGMPIETVGTRPPTVSQVAPEIPFEDAESLRRAEVFHQQNLEVQKLQQRMAAMQGLADLSKQAKASTGTGGSPFQYLTDAKQVIDTARQLPPTSPYNEIIGSGAPPIDPVLGEAIDSFARVPPTGVPGEPPPVLQLPEQAGPAGVETRPSIVGAQPDQPLDVVGAQPPTVSQPSRPFPELVQSTGELLASGLENQRPGPPRPTEATRVKMRDRQQYRDAHRNAARENLEEMEGSTHSRGKVVRDVAKGEEWYVPPTPGSGIYWDLIPKEEQHRPGITRAQMTDLLRIYADTGAKSAREIPSDYRGTYGGYDITVGQDGSHSLPRALRNAYDKYLPAIEGLADRRARQRMSFDERMRSAEGNNDIPGEGAPQGGEPTSSSDSLGAPPPEPEIPEWALEGPPDPNVTDAFDTDLEGPRPTAEFLAHGPDGPLYNVVGGPADRSTVSAAKLAELGIETPDTPPDTGARLSGDQMRAQALAARAKAGEPPPNPDQPSLLDRLKGEEGHLILDVGPKDPEGLKKWMVKQEREYGDQDWFINARRALDAGRNDEAYRLASTAAARSFDAATTNVGKAREKEPIPTTLPGEPPPLTEAQGRALRATQTELRASDTEMLELQERLHPGSTAGAPPPNPAAATAEVGGQPAQPKRFLLDEFMREEGHLVLDVDPKDRTGFKQWLKRQEGEYGDQDWYQQAVGALEGGDYAAARRIAEVAAARVSMGGVATSSAAQLKDLQKLTGQKLPKGTTIDHGVVKLPGNPGGLDPSATDMVLGRVFAKTLVDLTDPNTIVRIVDESGKVPSDLPKSLQMANQMADQYLRETDPELLQPMMEDLGITRAQLAAHFARKISDAGRNLGMVGNWVQANEEAFIRLDPDMPSTKGPGAAGRMEFVPEARAEVIANYMDILRRKGLTPSLLEKMTEAGYEAPKGVDPATKPGQQHARQWLRSRQKQITTGKIVDQVARKYNDTDTVMAAMGETPPIGKALEDASQFSLATMLAQASTAMNVFMGQSVRYGMGSMEEALSGVSARLRGDVDGSVQHFAMAKRLATTPFTQLDFLPKGMLHSPASENLETIFNYSRTSDPASVHKFLQALDKFPQEKARLQGARMMGDTEGLSSAEQPMTTTQRVRNLLTVGIRAQEMPMRVVVGDAVLRSIIAGKGDSPLEVLGSPEGLIGKYGEAESRNMLGTAISQALNYTFAGNPLPESPIGRVLGLMHDVPGLAPVIRTVRPFVRFSMATVPRFLWDRMGGLTLPVDLAMHHVWKTGRLSRGLQLDALQRNGGILDTTQTELANARFRAADTLNDSMGAMLEARQAKRALDKMGQRGSSTSPLPDDVQVQVDALKATYEKATETANEKRAGHLAARQEATDLADSYEKRLTRANQLREIDAPNFDAYVSRQTTGAMLMALAFGIRALDQNEGTKYYQHRADKDSPVQDLRSIIPGFAVYLHTADLFHDLTNHTDWKVLGETNSLSKAYTGKYQAADTMAAAMDDWFNVSYLTGMPGIIADLATGKTPEALSETSAQSMRDISLQWLGEQLGRFTTGFETAKDVAGTVNPEEAKRRTPERVGPNTPAWRAVLGPAMAHVPGVSEMLPERISPFTGEPISKPNPGVHQATGISWTEPLTPAEEEINRTGLPYSKAVPKVTGDQEFDNEVNKVYGALLKEYFHELTDDPEYQKLTPELKRDVLEKVFASLKQGAYAQVADTVGEDQAQQTLQSPGVKARRERWLRFLGELVEHPAEPPEDVPEPPPASVGAPPPAAP